MANFDEAPPQLPNWNCSVYRAKNCGDVFTEQACNGICQFPPGPAQPGLPLICLGLSTERIVVGPNTFTDRVPSNGSESDSVKGFGFYNGEVVCAARLSCDCDPLALAGVQCGGVGLLTHLSNFTVSDWSPSGNQPCD